MPDLLPYDLAQERNTCQTRTDVVVQVRGDSLSNAFQLRQPLFTAPAQRLLCTPPLGDVTRDAGEKALVFRVNSPKEISSGTS